MTHRRLELALACMLREMQIEAETEKARKRAERFGAEFSEPSLELILDKDELYLYKKITDPESLKVPKGPRVQYRSQVPARAFPHTQPHACMWRACMHAEARCVARPCS